MAGVPSAGHSWWCGPTEGSSSGTRGARADERQSGWTLAPRSGQDRKNRALQRLWAGNRAGRAVPLGHGALAAG